MKLQGKCAIVTGAGRGIGRSVALKLAAEGASVVVNDLDEAEAQAVTAEVCAAGGHAVACTGSVADPAFPQVLVDTCVESLGGLDILVNNAGYTWDNVVQKMTDEQWYAMIDVHLTGPFRILRAAQPVIRRLHAEETARGEVASRKVVNVSSIGGLGGNAGQAGYASAKTGVVGLTKTLAREWGRLAVNVNCVAFGPISTRLSTVTADRGARISVGEREVRIGVNPDVMESLARRTPLGRFGTPEEGAGAIYLFCIPESDFVTGQILLCSGGVETL